VSKTTIDRLRLRIAAADERVQRFAALSTKAEGAENRVRAAVDAKIWADTAERYRAELAKLERPAAK
jgi:hypothetical protein